MSIKRHSAEQIFRRVSSLDSLIPKGYRKRSLSYRTEATWL